MCQCTGIESEATEEFHVQVAFGMGTSCLTRWPVASTNEMERVASVGVNDWPAASLHAARNVMLDPRTKALVAIMRWARSGLRVSCTVQQPLLLVAPTNR